MKDPQTRRTRRTPQQIADDIDVKIRQLDQSIEDLQAKKAAAIADFDAKTELVKRRISSLEERRASVLAPRPKTKKPRVTKKQKIQALLKRAEKAGMKPEVIAQRLGLDDDEG